jgi:hypothetical protein
VIEVYLMDRESPSYLNLRVDQIKKAAKALDIPEPHSYADKKAEEADE